MDALPSIERRKREIVSEIQYLSKLKQKVDLFFLLPTLGGVLIFTRFYLKPKIVSLEQDFLALSEVEKRIRHNGSLFARKSRM